MTLIWNDTSATGLRCDTIQYSSVIDNIAVSRSNTLQ